MTEYGPKVVAALLQLKHVYTHREEFHGQTVHVDTDRYSAMIIMLSCKGRERAIINRCVVNGKYRVNFHEWLSLESPSQRESSDCMLRDLIRQRMNNARIIYMCNIKTLIQRSEALVMQSPVVEYVDPKHNTVSMYFDDYPRPGWTVFLIPECIIAKNNDEIHIRGVEYPNQAPHMLSAIKTWHRYLNDDQEIPAQIGLLAYILSRC